MKKTSISMMGVVALASGLVIGAGAASAAEARDTANHESAGHQAQDLKVGKKGDISFSSDTKVGDLVLKAGTYRIQHKFNGSDHMLHFTQLTKGNPYTVSVGVPKAHPGEVPCELKPLGSKVRYTQILIDKKDGMDRLVRAEIGGENVAHIL